MINWLRPPNTSQDGQSRDKGIGKHLHVAEGTVKLHVATILRLLNTCNRIQAVIEASRRGLIAYLGQSVSS